ncbi:MAG: dethiobiotin synthase [Mariprofundaceae bacterium]|nr:dethiobiotin synthase [Mariprofundaceae bacterium]
MSACVFITASDTDAGKTWVTEQLSHLLQQQGHDALAVKPVVSGYRDGDDTGDVQRLLRVQGLHNASDISYYRFRQAAAPLIAAASEGREVVNAPLHAWCIEQCQQHETVLIEGIGGLMVPLNTQTMVIDWMQNLPLTHVLLCVELKLGCINHTLLSVEALQRRNQTPAWLVLNERHPLPDKAHTAAMVEVLRSQIPAQTQLLHCTAHSSQALQTVVDAITLT